MARRHGRFIRTARGRHGTDFFIVNEFDVCDKGCMPRTGRIVIPNFPTTSFIVDIIGMLSFFPMTIISTWILEGMPGRWPSY